MNKDNLKTILYFFIGLYLFLAIPIGSAEILSQLFDNNSSSMYQTGYIVGLVMFFSLIYYIATEKDKKLSEKQAEYTANLHKAIHFVDLINKYDYSNLHFIKKIHITELSYIKFIFINNNQVQLRIDEINDNIIYKNGINNLDNYLNSNYSLSQIKSDKDKILEQLKLKDAIKYYHS